MILHGHSGSGLQARVRNPCPRRCRRGSPTLSHPGEGRRAGLAHGAAFRHGGSAPVRLLRRGSRLRSGERRRDQVRPGEGSWDASGPDFYKTRDPKRPRADTPGSSGPCPSEPFTSARPGCPGMTAVSVRTGPALRLGLSPGAERSPRTRGCRVTGPRPGWRPAPSGKRPRLKVIHSHSSVLVRSGRGSGERARLHERSPAPVPASRA